MADVIGPGSQLPGSLLTVPVGVMCDNHPDRLAVKRIVGETDSFGSEVEDLCQECYDADRKAMAEADKSGVCDWCKKHADVVVPHRDIEEGSCGRVYDVCLSCIDEERARWQEENDDDDIEWDDCRFPDEDEDNAW